MRERGVAALFHWTPARSLGSILQHGVLSRSELRAARIKVVLHSYGSREKEAALSNYVALSFRPKLHMMMAWSENPVILEIDRSVAFGAGTLFIPGNSASARFDSVGLLAFQGVAAFEELWPRGNSGPISQAEVWVRTRVPRLAIRRILVRTEGEAAELRKLVTPTASSGFAPAIDVQEDMLSLRRLS
jgi:hypothetical protein